MRVIVEVHKDEANRINENLRVVKSGKFYLVQTYSDKMGIWISQKEYFDVRKAIADCLTWY